ncbi:MAG: cobalamin-binding protein [Clostridia bacterium]|nr:cobalamin-binding protein [Clostridia bacterium]
MKRILLAVMTLLLLTVVVGCSQSKETDIPAKEGFPLKITDATKNEVVIEAKPKRIVSLTPSNTEILFALGLEKEIVGVTTWCDYPAKAKEKEKIGDLTTNVEKVVALQPDLVVATASMNDQAIGALRKLGVTVLAVEPQNVREVTDAVQLIAKATGKETKGQEVVKGMQDILAQVEKKLSQLTAEQKVKVFIEVGYEPLFTAGKGSFVDDLVRSAGGINVASEVKAYQQYSLEQLLTVNPQVILATDYYYLKENQKVEKRADWKNIEAVKQGRVIGNLDANLLTRPGPRSAEAVKAIAQALYPDLFK